MASQQLNIRISEEEHQHLENLASQTEGILTKQAVARLLIKHAIATGWKPLTLSDTLVERRGDTPARVDPLSGASKAVTSSCSSSLNTSNKERKVRSSKVKRTKGTPEFEQFWVVYQSCPKKANCQSKAKAWECWEQLVPEVDAQDLISAAQKAVDEANDREMAGQFCADLPDAFRWLRDERYLVLLEAHTPAQTERIKLF